MMKKTNLIFSLLAIVALMFTSCGEGGKKQDPPDSWGKFLRCPSVSPLALYQKGYPMQFHQYE